MSNRALSAIIVAALMVVAVPMMAGSYDSDADDSSSVSGTYSVYAYNGTAWSSDIVQAYDAAQAVQASNMWTSDDSMVPKYTSGTWVTYNWSTYGNITTFMGVTNADDSIWNVFVVNTLGNIVKADDCLGSYRCFSDYATDNQTANIILYYGASTVSATDVATSFSSYTSAVSPSAITQVTETQAFKVTFTLSMSYTGVTATFESNVYDVDGDRVTDSALKSSTVTVVGYGSDCYIALKDAIGSDNISGMDTIPGEGYYAYSWMESMFGLGTVQTAGTSTPTDWSDDSYAYWCIYDDAGHLADFVIGAYSPLECAGEPFADSTISLVYAEVSM